MARFSPDYQKAMEPLMAAAARQPPPPLPKNVIAMRKEVNDMMAAAFGNPPAPKDIIQTVFEVPVPATNKAVAVTRFATAEQTAAKRGQPAVIYLHPGGMVCASVEFLAAPIANEIAQTGVQHWAVDYSKSPEVAAPVALEEAYAVLQWLAKHAAELGIDNTRIGVAGASAGGGLAAGLALLARDRGFAPPIAKLIMIYPMLDDRTVQAHPPRGARHAGGNAADDDWPMRPFLTWTCEQNAMAWAAYLGVGNPWTDDALTCAANLAKASAIGSGPGAGTAATYAIPARAASLMGLPSSYIDVGGLDLFAEECVQFAARLARDQVDFDLHVFSGVPHGFEGAPATNAAKTALEQRRVAFNSF